MKTNGEWGYSAVILGLGTRWRRLVSFTPWLLYSGERAPAIHFTGGWVGPRVGLDEVEMRKISCPFQESISGHPACIPSLYRLRSPGSRVAQYKHTNPENGRVF
jgi:hypothetical protein